LHFVDIASQASVITQHKQRGLHVICTVSWRQRPDSHRLAHRIANDLGNYAPL